MQRAKTQVGAPPDRDAAVLAAVTEIVRDVCGDSAIILSAETEIDTIPAWQELTCAGIAVEVECRFDVMFQAPEIVALRTVGDLVALIARKRAGVHA